MKKVLVLDESARLCTDYIALLQGEGYDVHLRRSVEEALEFLQKNDSRLLLCDSKVLLKNESALFNFLRASSRCSKMLVMTTSEEEDLTDLAWKLAGFPPTAWRGSRRPSSIHL